MTIKKKRTKNHFTINSDSQSYLWSVTYGMSEDTGSECSCQ